jgi:hypothetical protein
MMRIPPFILNCAAGCCRIGALAWYFETSCRGVAAISSRRELLVVPRIHAAYFTAIFKDVDSPPTQVSRFQSGSVGCHDVKHQGGVE